MAVISGGFNTNTDVLEEKLNKTDFSKYTDLKSSLAQRLFRSKETSKVTRFEQLSDDLAELVNAAQGIWTEDPRNK